MCTNIGSTDPCNTVKVQNRKDNGWVLLYDCVFWCFLNVLGWNSVQQYALGKEYSKYLNRYSSAWRPLVNCVSILKTLHQPCQPGTFQVACTDGFAEPAHEVLRFMRLSFSFSFRGISLGRWVGGGEEANRKCWDKLLFRIAELNFFQRGGNLSNAGWFWIRETEPHMIHESCM